MEPDFHFQRTEQQQQKADENIYSFKPPTQSDPNKQTTMIIKNAVSKKDPSLCKSLSTSDMVNSCYVTIATTLNDSKICELIDGSTKFGASSYDSCYSEIAKNLKDESYCSYVKDTSKFNHETDQCYSTVAIFKNDSSVCTKIKLDLIKDICVEGFVRRTGDLTLCNLLPEITYQQACQEDPTATSCTGFIEETLRATCLNRNATHQPGKPEITVTSPNGGEVWKVGEKRNITWLSTGLSNKVNIYLVDLSARKNYVIAENLDFSNGNHSIYG